jgi:tRNA pseudouridine55 synthase
MCMKHSEFHGLLVLDKPSGISSRAALTRVQGWFPRRTRMGHTGTLDPLATGVLVICLGVATRLADYVQAMSKTYTACIRLGAVSDTQDAEGEITPVEVDSIPTAANVASALRGFVGEVDQVPPNFSAAKVFGRRAYLLARRGQTPTLNARRIVIHSIDPIAYEYPRLEIEVNCGKGTYIRSLARDLGDELGCGAYIEALRRTRVGPFHVAQTAAVADLPRFTVDQHAILDLEHGRAIACATAIGAEETDSCTVAALDVEGKLIAVGTKDTDRKTFSPFKVFCSLTQKLE